AQPLATSAGVVCHDVVTAERTSGPALIRACSGASAAGSAMKKSFNDSASSLGARATAAAMARSRGGWAASEWRTGGPAVAHAKTFTCGATTAATQPGGGGAAAA